MNSLKTERDQPSAHYAWLRGIRIEKVNMYCKQLQVQNQHLTAVEVTNKHSPNLSQSMGEFRSSINGRGYTVMNFILLCWLSIHDEILYPQLPYSKTHILYTSHYNRKQGKFSASYQFICILSG